MLIFAPGWRYCIYDDKLKRHLINTIGLRVDQAAVRLGFVL